MATIQVIAGILLVFGLLALFYWLANRLNGGRGFKPSDSKIEILEARNIGDKRTLLLVRVGDETLLLGATSTNIALLSNVPESSLAEPAGDEADRPAEPNSRATFRGLLEMLR